MDNDTDQMVVNLNTGLEEPLPPPSNAGPKPGDTPLSELPQDAADYGIESQVQ